MHHLKNSNKITKVLGSLTLAAAVMGVVSMPAQAALHYTADCGVKELKMAKGKSSINRAGAIKGDKYCEYTFYAKKGQKVSANLIGSDDLYPMLYGDVSQNLADEPAVLDKTGEFSIRVLQPRNQAREGNTPKPYYLTISIK